MTSTTPLNNSVRRPKRHTLEKQFVCVSFIATIALICYAIIHTNDNTNASNDDLKWYNNKYGRKRYLHKDRRLPRLRRNETDSVHDMHRKVNTSQHKAERVISHTNAASYNNATIRSFFTSVDEQYLHNGRVVRELSHRILSRKIAQSNVVIVSPNFITSYVFNDMKRIKHGEKIIEKYYPAKIAVEEGHTTHLIPASITSDSSSTLPSVGWILLAYFATQKEDTTVHKNQSPITIDEILTPPRTKIWLQETTITYIVFPISAKASIPLSSILLGQHEHLDYEYEMDYIADKLVEVIGLTAAQTLLDFDYKLQLLSSSHYFDNNDQRNVNDDAYYYGPNALFQSTTKALHRFLYDQVTRILSKEVSYIRQQHHSQQAVRGMMDAVLSNHTAQTLEVEFHSLLFATQGLDLAIPSRSSYTDLSNHKECKHEHTQQRKARCDPKLNARALNDTIFLQCPKRHAAVDIQFVDEENISGLRIAGTLPQNVERVRNRRVLFDRTAMEKKYGIMIDIDEKWLVQKFVNKSDIEVWLGDNEQHDKAEAACVKLYRDAIHPRVSCTTRILPSATDANVSPSIKQTPTSGRPNLLLIMIDPLSRQQLRRSLPNTWALLELLGFQYFPQYTAVGNNSGPNQAALFSGLPLNDGRQGIRTSSNNTKRIWLWDRLNDAGYVTMKAEDGCVSNSNMVQSISPQTHHGKQLQEMFCFHYDRPNCLDSKLAAEHLVEYTRQFIDTYHRNDSSKKNHTKPWAAFVSFIDSHEDSSTLISYLDNILLNFLQDVPMDNTMILFTSDHGLHYGPYFASSVGELERAQPLLYMRLPTFKKDQLHQNQQKSTTPYDVHETILHVLLGERDDTSIVENNNKLGTSLLTPLPQSRYQCTTTPGIPPGFCSLIKEEQTNPNQCTFMKDPPSLFSFFSDIPHYNRPHWPNHCPIRQNHDINSDTIPNKPCLCATNHRNWFDCSNISRDEFRLGINNTEQFSLRSCGHQHDLDQSLELNIHVKKNEQVVQEQTTLAKSTMHRLAGTHSEDNIKASFDSQPNIIFLEIDSVSLSYAERHFPKTMSLLSKHKIVSDDKGASTCPSSWCASMFNQTSVVGQSSIVNQLAALSGCIQYNDKGERLHQYKGNGPATFCPSVGTISLGVNEDTNVPYDHWVYDVAKQLGYVTFFGEEFCYQDSPYVVQTQSAFTLDVVDLTLSELYCNLATNHIKVNGITDVRFETYAVEYDDRDVPDSCFDGMSRGEIGLDYIKQMWEAYDSQPKFAFLNALAAHDYSLDAAHTPLSAENYDSVVFEFLTNIMARDDPRDTVIILRSDHGLQGGPTPIEYSSQIEHMHPLTAIITPARHQSISISSLASNQNRLATGFDLYHSLRYLMSPDITKKSSLFDAGIPRWSYNLFQQTIPSDRSCSDAKIPAEFCPCINERKDMAPSFYVGHSETTKKTLPLPILRYVWKSNKFVASKLPGYLVPRDYGQSKYEVKTNTHISPPQCNLTLGSYIDENIIQESWQLIDNITSLYPESDISGGIFLYNRQSIILTYLVQQAAMKNGTRPFRVCETGFGSGHSAALFLSAAPNVEVVSFDKFDRPYQMATFHALRGLFGKRLSQTVGDSCKTFKAYTKKCDFLHGSSLCRTDNIDLINKADVGVTLTSTAMNSLYDRSVYFGKDAQWATLRKKGCIENIVCFEEEAAQLDAKLYLARGKEQKISHKFCIATNTGTCHDEGKEDSSQEQNPVAAVSISQWSADDFCPSWQLNSPLWKKLMV